VSSLEQSEKGYLLQVEAGRVDHAGHANDPAAILHDTLEFDETVKAVIDYVDAHPDTLLIVTTDHGTGGCQLNGLGSAYVDSGPALDRIEICKGSFESLEKAFLKTGVFDAALFEQTIGIKPTAEQVAEAQGMIDAEVKYLSSALTSVFAKQLFDLTAIGWTSNNHTSENVELLAFGPGSEQIPTFVKNYELFQIMRDTLHI
jgi:alkaline phosphatase